jgi:hypothetical protein
VESLRPPFLPNLSTDSPTKYNHSIEPVTGLRLVLDPSKDNLMLLSCGRHWLRSGPQKLQRPTKYWRGDLYFSTSPRMMQNQPTTAKEKHNVKSKEKHQKDLNEKNSGDKVYASTLLLPKTNFPIWIEPSITKERYHQLTTEGLYTWQAS